MLAAPAAPAKDPDVPLPEPTRELDPAAEGLVKAPLMADALQQQARSCRRHPCPAQLFFVCQVEQLTTALQP